MTDFNRQALIASLKKHEGFRPYAYQDSLGLWTIGIGRLCDRSKAGSGLTEAEAEYLLANDIARVEASLTTSLPWMKSLSDARQRVLLEMAFQLGVNGLLGFRTTLDAIKGGSWQAAHDGMLNSKWARQTPARAKRLAEQMLKG